MWDSLYSQLEDWTEYTQEDLEEYKKKPTKNNYEELEGSYIELTDVEGSKFLTYNDRLLGEKEREEIELILTNHKGNSYV